MGRRSINTTKSGKYMNPTDQARKEARKKELKKNKKQRMMVRQAVLKGKDPLKILEDMEFIDKMEYNPLDAPKLNEKVLKDKRKKLKETFQRVISMYEKEDPEYAVDLWKKFGEYEAKRLELQVYFEQVKNAERVQIESIPLPETPEASVTSQIPLPGEIPLPALSGITLGGAVQPADKPIRGILKHGLQLDKDTEDIPMPEATPVASARKRKPPGPPPGAPPSLSEFEESDSEDEGHPTEKDDMMPPPSKSRKIRFHDDATRDPEEPEKDTRLKFRPAVSTLQAKMLQMAGQEVPKVFRDEEEQSNSDESDKEEERDSRRRKRDRRRRSREESDSDSDNEYEKRKKKKVPTATLR